MSALFAAVVLVGLLCAIDLLLTLAVVRRLREHEERFASLPAGTPGPGFDREKFLGVRLPEFSVTATNGATVSRDVLLGQAGLVGFFSSSCAPCRVQAPEFARHAGEAAQSVALAFVIGPGADDLVGVLSEGVAAVVVDPDAAELVRQLEVGAFPTILRLGPEGSIVDAGPSVRELVEPSRA